MNILCVKCKLEKASSEFYTSKTTSSGFQSYCIECQRAYQRDRHKNKTPEQRERDRKRVMDRAAQFPDERYWIRIKSVYGLTKEEFLAILESQGGRCAICGTTSPGGRRRRSSIPGWTVDHDHQCCSGINSCGACIRGILCMPCNAGLGQFKDDPELIRAALAYLGVRV